MDYVLDNVPGWVIEGKNRLVNNSVKSFEGMTTQRWIRIVAIVGAYLLIRPYLVKGAENRAKKAMAQEAEDLGLESSAGPNANDLRNTPSTKKTEKKADADDSVDGVPSARKTRSRKA